MRKLKLLLLALIAFVSANSQYINRDGYSVWMGNMYVGHPRVGTITAPPNSVWVQFGDSATTKAMWLPRVQHLGDITEPKAGMLLFCLDSAKIFYYSGIQWVAPGTGSGGASLSLQQIFNLEPGGPVLTKNDTINLNTKTLSLLNGNIRTTGQPVSIKSTDSLYVKDSAGNWKSISQWNLNGGQARTGFYLNSTKTWTKQVPYVFGTNLLFSGNSWSNEHFTSGTPWPTQITNYYSKTKVLRGRDADDITGMIMRDYNTYNGRQSDSIGFCDLTIIPLVGLVKGSSPYGGFYYADGFDVTKTMNYIRGSWRSFIANYYLDTDTFSVNSLSDANFRPAVASDSLGTKTAVGSIGLGAFSFTKPAGKTSLVIGTYGADGVRTHQGTIVVTSNGTEIFRKNYDSLNIANRGRDYKIKTGLHYEAIVLKDLPSASSTITVTALDDSTRFDYIGYLVPADSAQKPLYINNIAYGAGKTELSCQRQYIDSANLEIQNAVTDFIEYPVFINNTNRTLDSTNDITTIHLTSSGNNTVAAGLTSNIVKIGYKPVITRGAAASGGGSGTVTSIGTGFGLSGGAITSSGTILVDSSTLSTHYLRRKDSLTTSNLLGYVTRTVLKDTAANFVRTSQSIYVDTSGATNNQIAYIKRSAGQPDTIRFRTEATSSGSGAYSILDWFEGAANAPAINDTTMANAGFSGKYLVVFRNGVLWPYIVGDTGWSRVNDTTIKVVPAFADNEHWHIEARDSSSLTTLALQAPYVPPSTTIAYVSSTDGGNNGGLTSSRTFSHTTGSGSDRYLLVGVIGDVTSGANDPVSVTYNGVSMTLIDSMKAVSGGNRYNYVWGLANPASGSHNVVVTFSSAHYILTGAIEYSGVQGVDVTTKADAYLNSVTTSITTTANNAWPVIFSTTTGLSQSAGTGATERAEAASNYWAWYDSNGPVTPAGSYSMTTTSFSGSGICHIIIALKPY